jgi:hypothetical protein
MGTSNNAILIDTTSVNNNEFLSHPPLNSTETTSNLEMFDFETFFAESQVDLPIPVDYANLLNIDFTDEDYAISDGARCCKPNGLESLEGAEHYESPDHRDPNPKWPAFVPRSISPHVAPVPPDPYSHNVYTASNQAYGTDRTGPQQVTCGDQKMVEQQIELDQAFDSASERIMIQAQPSRVPKATRKTAPTSTRTLNIIGFDASRFYKPLLEPLKRSWSPPYPLETLFEYNAQGELDPRCSFSREQISNYLTYHPLHTFHHPSPSTKQSGLILWVQTTPADAGNRYPTKLSSKCRFADCPVPNRTIRKGNFRVAFDEQSVFDKSLDPFHNAGYVHLFCLEKNFDFPRLCKRFNIQGDDREIPEGRNKMAITRDHPAMLDIVNNFIQTSSSWGCRRPENWYDYSLSLALTRHHLACQSKLRQHVRDARNGNSIDRHLNNLDVMIEIGEAIRNHKASEGKKPKNPRKRKVSEMEDLNEEVD